MPLQRLDDSTVLDTDTGQTIFYPASISQAAPMQAPAPGPVDIPGLGQVPGSAFQAPQVSPSAPVSAPPVDVQPPAPVANPLRSPGLNPADFVGISNIPQARVRAAQNNYASAISGAGAQAVGAEEAANQEKRAGQAQQALAYAAGGGQAPELNALGPQAAQLRQETDALRGMAQHEAQLKAAAHEKAVARWQDWQNKYQDIASKETDPSRWWNTRTGFQKTMGILSLAAGAWVQDKYGKNTALELINRFIDQDIAAQSENRAAKMKALEGQRPAIEALNQEEQGKANDYASERVLRLKSLQDRINGMIQESGADSRKGIALAQIGAGLEQAKNSAENEVLAGYIGDEQTKAKNQFEMQKIGAQEGAANYRARLAQSGENYRTGLQVGAKVSAAEAKQAAAEKKAEDKSAETGLVASPQTGISVVDKDGNPLRVWDVGTKETNNEIKKEIASGQQAYDTLRRLQKALDDDPGFLKQISEMEISSAKSDALLQTIYTRIRGNSSERENDLAKNALLGYAGNIGLLLKGGNSEDLVAKQADELARSVNKRLAVAGSPANPEGSKVFWKPQDLPTEDEVTPSTGEKLAGIEGAAKEAGVDVKFQKQPDTSQEQAKASAASKLGDETYTNIRDAAKKGDANFLKEIAKKPGKIFKEISPGYKVDMADLANLQWNKLVEKTRLEKFGITDPYSPEARLGAWQSLIRSGYGPDKLQEVYQLLDDYIKIDHDIDYLLAPPKSQ